MSEPTKDDLLEFMKKHGPERVDSITDKDSAIKHFRTSSKLYKQQRDQYKAERDTCFEDIDKLRERNKELERENEKLTKRVRKLNLTAQIEHDELMSSDGEVRYWKNLYTTLTNHIRMKAEANPGVSRYIDLVNYIDRLERD